MDLLPWPGEWRRDEQWTRSNVAKGSSGIRVVEVEADGVVESGLLVPFRRTSRWAGVLFVLIGTLCLGLVGAGGVVAVVNQEWGPVGGAFCFGVIAAIFLFLGYAVLAEPRDAEPGLRLTPTRIVGPQFAVPWDEIVQVRPYLADSGSGNPIGNGSWTNNFGIEVRDPDAVLPARVGRTTRWVLRNSQGAAVITVTDKQLATHPLLAYHLVRHYFEHPTERPDITRALA